MTSNTKIQSVNNCVIKFANVNGSGSASANSMFAKAVFRMGIPVSPRNIFPSNIQGLPTWYEVRINEKGYLGRKEKVDLVVTMNAETLSRDIATVSPGGYVLYDSTKYLTESLRRSEIEFIGVPFTRLCIEQFGNVKARHMYKNIMYVGSLAAILNMEVSLFEELISEQFKNKPTMIEPNIDALMLGYNYAKEHFNCPISVQLRRSDAVGDKIMLEGNTGLALGCIYSGATVCGWYPITPSTSVVDAFAKYAERLRTDPETGQKKFAIVQAEDELAAIGMVIGAGWNGARAFTATSGPGLSLMNEFLGLAYFAEIPAVLMNIQRGGPSTGMPTRTQQSDITSAAYASHGDTKHILLFPQDANECFVMGADAFDLADRLQTPVIVMSDLEIGMNSWLSEPLKWNDSRKFDRGKVLDAKELDEIEMFGRYLDVDGDGICYRTYPGTHESKGGYFTRGTSRDRYAIYTESSEAYIDNVDRLSRKFETAKSLIHAPIIQDNGNDLGLIYFGSTSTPIQEVLDDLKEQGLKVDTLRIRAFPFHDDIENFIDSHDKCIVIEQNRDGQMKNLLMTETRCDNKKLESLLHYGGMPVPADFITNHILDMLGIVAVDNIIPVKNTAEV